MPKLKREAKKHHYNKPCCYCRRVMVPPGSIESEEDPGLTCSVEHYTPKSRGGTNEQENIKYSCSNCNQLKGNMLPELFEPFARHVLQKYPNVPTPILRDALKQYIMVLAEVACRNRIATRKAATVTLLQIGVNIKGR